MQTAEELYQHYLDVRRRLRAAPQKKTEVATPKIEIRPEPEPEPNPVVAPKPKPALSPAQLIIYNIALKHGLTYADIMGKSRQAHIVTARHEAMYELHKTGKYTLSQLGRFMHRDHTTILSACRKMKKTRLQETG
jgi:hypothetical protein